jgi:hypothetical protein
MARPGVKLNGKHSWTDYGLILAEAEIGFPAPKTELLDVPGSDGVLDYTVFLTDSVRYGTRAIKLTFRRWDRAHTWLPGVQAFLGEAQGKKVFLVFDDDPNHAYIGRAAADPVRSDLPAGTVVLNVDCDPYRYGYDSTREMDWQWDDVIENDAIIYYGTFDVTETKARTLINPLPSAVTPTFICSSAMSVSFGGQTVSLPQGTSSPAALALQPGKNVMTFTGTGRVLVDYAVATEGVRVL